MKSKKKRRKKRTPRKREKVKFSANAETLSMNAMQTRGVLGIPLDEGMDDWLVFFGG